MKIGIFSLAPLLAILQWFLPLFSALIISSKYRILKGRSGRIIEVLGIYVSQVIVVQYVLGMLGGLNAINSILCCSFLAFLLWRLCSKEQRTKVKDDIQKILHLRLELRSPETILGLVVAIVFVVYSFLYILKPPTHYDYVLSQLVEIAGWNQTQSILKFHETLLSFYYNSGLLWVNWFILPLGNYALVNVQTVPIVFWIVVSLYHLLRCFIEDKRIAFVLSLSILSFPFFDETIWKQVVEFLFAGVFLQVLLYFIYFLREKNRRALFYTFFFLGLLVGVKAYGLVYGFVIFLCISGYVFRKISLRDYILLTLFCAFVASMWAVRNAILWGNPFYPMDITIKGYHLLKGFSQEAKLDNFFSQLSPRSLLLLLWNIFSRFGFVFVLATLTFFTFLFRKSSSELLFLKLVVIGNVLVYPFIPATNFVHNNYYLMHIFIVLPFFLMQIPSKYSNYLYYLILCWVMKELLFYMDSELLGYNALLIDAAFIGLVLVYYGLGKNTHLTLGVLVLGIVLSGFIYTKIEKYLVHRTAINKLYQKTTSVSSEVILWANTHEKPCSILMVSCNAQAAIKWLPHFQQHPNNNCFPLKFPLLGFHLNNKVQTYGVFDEKIPFHKYDYVFITGKTAVAVPVKVDSLYKWVLSKHFPVVLKNDYEMIIQTR